MPDCSLPSKLRRGTKDDWGRSSTNSIVWYTSEQRPTWKSTIPGAIRIQCFDIVVRCPERNIVDVSAIVEQQKLGRFLIGLVLVSWIITFFDGLDSNLISFAAPYFGAQYHLSKIQLGNIFSMGLFGTMVGGFALGYFGDRIGRRPAVIFATALFGILTMCFALANSYWSLLSLRFIDGLPLGGMLPLAWALNIEYAPKRYRATIVTVIMMGYSLGTALGGPIAIWLIPKFGWKSVFVFGGAFSLFCAGVLFAILPESIRFLASKGLGAESDRRHCSPHRARPIHSRRRADSSSSDENQQNKDFKPSLLFRGELRADHAADLDRLYRQLAGRILHRQLDAGGF